MRVIKSRLRIQFIVAIFRFKWITARQTAARLGGEWEKEPTPNGQHRPQTSSSIFSKNGSFKYRKTYKWIVRFLVRIQATWIENQLINQDQAGSLSEDNWLRWLHVHSFASPSSSSSSNEAGLRSTSIWLGYTEQQQQPQRQSNRILWKVISQVSWFSCCAVCCSFVRSLAKSASQQSKRRANNNQSRVNTWPNSFTHVDRLQGDFPILTIHLVDDYVATISGVQI